MRFAFGCRRAGFRAAGRLLVSRLTLPVLVAGAGVLCPLGARAQTAPARAVPDTVAGHTVELSEARVEAARLPAGRASLSRPSETVGYVTRLRPADLRAVGPGATLGALLAQRTPLVVRQYGPGQLASLSVRGTTAQHVAVLWQGFNITFPTLGQADLSLLPAAALTGAELRHGPDAARSGSGAIGGALTLETGEALAADGTVGEATVGIGAFGQQAASARVSGRRAARGGFSTSLQASRATNDFAYHRRTFQGRLTERQVNAATRSYSLTHHQYATLGSAWELTGAAWLTGADRQLAPPLNTPNNAAREQDASQRLMLGLTHRARTYLRVASLTDVINYADALSGPSDARSQSWQAQLGHCQPISPSVTLRGGIEGQRFGARVDGYGPGQHTENRAAATGELTWQDADDRGNVQLTVRQAVIPGQRVPVTPALGAAWKVWHAAEAASADGRPLARSLLLKAGAARAYRAPTLNERYWRVGGNPGLRAETSDGYQAGLQFVDHATRVRSAAPARQYALTAEVMAFDQRVQDWVQWTPDPRSGLWSPRNLRRVRSRGVEGQLDLTRGSAAGGGQSETTLHLAGQLLQTRKTAGAPADPDPVGVQLPYVPARTGSLTLTHRHPVRHGRGTLAADLSGTLTSQRTTNASGTEALPAYGLLNAGLWGEWAAGPAQLRLRLDGFNLLGTEYQSLTNRPMPGRAWLLTLGVLAARYRSH